MFKHRTAAAFVCIFALGVVAAAFVSPSDTASFCTVFAVLFTACLAACLFLRGKEGKRLRIAAALAFAVAAFSFGALRVGITQTAGSGFAAFDGKSDVVTVKVSSVGNYSYSCVIDGSITASDISVPNGTKVRLRIYNYEGDPVLPGDLVRATAEYSGPAGRDLLAEGIKKEAKGGIIAVVRGSGLMYSLRGGILRECGEFFTDRASRAAAKAVTVGDRSELGAHIYSVYSNAGISHLLAISGLHISLVSSALFYLLLAFGANKRVCGVAGALFSLFYAALVGFTPGALRAALMTFALMSARIFNYRADSITSMFLALFALALYNPYTLFSTGTQLSFLCCLGVIFISPYLERFGNFVKEKRAGSGFFRSAAYKLLYVLAAPAAVSLAASVFSLPASYLSFERISYLSPLVNVIAIPLYSLAIILSLVAVAVGALIPAVGSVIAAPAQFIFSAVTKGANVLYSAGVGSVTLRTAVMRVPLFFALAVIAVLLFVRKRRLLAVSASAFCFVLAFAVCALINRADINSTSVLEYCCGNNEYLYFASEGENYYVDLGGFRSCRDSVFTTGYSNLGAYIVASADNRASARFEEISGRMRVSKLFLPETADEASAKVYNEIILLAKSRGCDIIKYKTEEETVYYSGKTGFIAEKGFSAFTFDSASFTARVFNGESGGSRFCDTALFTKNYVSGPERLYCSLACMPQGVSAQCVSARQTEYGESVRITRKNNESEFCVNVPGYS